MDTVAALGLTGPSMLLGLVALVFLDGFFPPIPSEIALVTAGSIAAEGGLSAGLLVAAGALGSWLADLGVYFTFRNGLNGVLDRSRWGRRVHGTAHRVVLRFGEASTFGAIIGIRFLAGGRLTSSAAAGIGEVPLRAFSAAAAVGGLLWSGWHVALGYVAGRAMGLPFWASAAIGTGVGIAVGLLIATLAAIRHRRLRAREADQRP